MKSSHLLKAFALSSLAAMLSISTATLEARTSSAPLNDQVGHQLRMLPYIGVFDNLSYSVDGGNVTLSGQVVRPVDKSDAESAVKSLVGVQHVDNQIEVLPLSPFDDQIRVATFRYIARTSSLGKYFQGTQPAIRIIVRNGHVTLDGEVLNQGDFIMANMAANQVPGVFSVTNNLHVEIR